MVFQKSLHPTLIALFANFLWWPSTLLAFDSLELYGHQIIKSDVHFQGELLGGISGIRYNAEKGVFIGASDDKNSGKARLYTFDREFTSGGMGELRPKSLTYIGANGEFSSLDVEDLEIWKGRGILLGVERAWKEGEVLPYQIMLINDGGRLLKSWPLPAKFQMSSEGQGIQYNKGIEGLAFNSKQSELFVSTEWPLTQDRTFLGPTKGGVIRILRYGVQKGGELKVLGEYAYPLDPLASLSHLESVTGDNGVVAILPLEKAGELLVMERAWIREERRQNVRLYRASLDYENGDIQKIFSLKKGESYPVARKKLILNLNDIAQQIRDKKGLDNFEGLTFGPPLREGDEKTLFVVSDNNFSPYQRTLFLQLVSSPLNLGL